MNSLLFLRRLWPDPGPSR